MTADQSKEQSDERSEYCPVRINADAVIVLKKPATP